MKLAFMIVSLLLNSSALADSLDLDQLLKKVKSQQGIDSRINRQREAEFLAQKQQQQSRLQQVQTELKKHQQQSASLKQQLEANEQELAVLETQLQELSGELGELFGVARQAAGDLKAEFRDSIISAQYPQRTERLDTLANSKALPTIDQLQQLWFSLQQEMTESSKVVKYHSQLQTASGEPVNAEVVRIGAFNVMANGKYLRYLPETGQLSELSRQPAEKYLDMAQALASLDKGPVKAAVDPTRGVILSMLIQTPDTMERIHQGGVIGYIILALGGVGLVFAVIRLGGLAVTGNKMQSQINSPSISEQNPLGRVLAAADKADSEDVETVELLLDEAITREVPALERGLSLIKLLAAVAPLLGLLGTVTGMISTFQSISLYGTGDPKLMAGGISQALVTTMLGLCVALPLLFLHSLVASRSRVLVQILDEQSAGLVSRRAGK